MSTFDHVDLKQIDPNIEPINGGVYSLRVTDAKMVEYEKEGNKNKRISFSFTVFNDSTYAGRRVFTSLFEGEFALKALRRLMDATGIVKETDETLESWLDKLVTERAEFRTSIDRLPDVHYKTGLPNPNNVKPDGTPGDKNEVNWFRLAPVS